MKPNRTILHVLLAVVPALAVAGCSSPKPLAGNNGTHVEIVPLKSYGVIQSDFMLWLVGIKGLRASHTIDCYRILYPSTDDKGRPITLSGLLALPRDSAPKGLVSFQHGTTSDRDEVPSNLSQDGLAAAVLFAGDGYATIAPDYIGLGVSKGAHPYFVAADTARAVVDMIHAVRHIEGVPETPPLLVGFSEGGYASLAAQRAMEAGGESVRATAAIAGAYNLRTISIPWTLKGRSEQATTYLALWVRGYAQRYGHPLASAFAPRYVTLVPQLLDTPHADVVKALPRDPRALFLPSVLDAIDGKGDHWLIKTLNDNEMADWTAKAPIRFYYGEHDIDVPPLEQTTTAGLMAKRGSDVKVVSTGPQDHNESVLAAAPMIVRWFDSLSPTPGA